MFNLTRKKHAIRVFSLVFILISLAIGGFLALKHLNFGVNATSDGGTVNISYGPTIYYDGWETNHFYVASGGANYDAFCAQPSLGTPGGAYTADLITSNENKFKQLKLMIYISTYDNSYTRAARNTMFNWGPSNDEMYAWSHAIMGVIYGGDYKGLSPGNVTYVNNMINVLQGYIDNDNPVWAIAKNFTLYRTLGGGEVQDVIWIENNYQYGTINVQKCDKITNACSSQGNASLAGIEFKVYNDSGAKIYNPRADRLYNNGELVAEGVTDTNGSISFTNLLANNVRYKVVETATNTSYELTATQQTTTLNGNNASVTLNFYNDVVSGSITVKKADSETNTCTTVGKYSFDGTAFQLINNSTNAITYNGTSYAKNAVIDTKRLANGSCSVKFENLPYGSYIVKETATGVGYELNDTPQSVDIPASGSSNDATITFKNQIIRGDVKFVKIDEANGTPMSDVLFSISAIDDNQMGETHIVVSDQNGVVDTSASFALHTFHTNGYDALYDEPNPIFFSGYGTWFGYDSDGISLTPNDNLGALPYGKYVIQELKCGANLFCSGVKDQKTTVTINSPNQVVDLGDWNNTCAKFSLETEATDAEDDDKYIEASGTATIKDTISYCAKAGMEFMIKGVLMDKSTGEKFLNNGQPVESTLTIKPEEDCGETEMFFSFDSENLGGTELVVFEELYYKDVLIVAHNDINDEGQTVELLRLTTYATNRDDGSKILPHDQEEVVIRDVVKYCLKPGLEYTIMGILVNRETGEELLINDEAIEQEVTFTPEERCGELEMFYTLATTDLQGAKLVIYEALLRDDEFLVVHEDVNNEDESVEVSTPAPDTGSITKTSSHQSGDSFSVPFYIAIVAVVSVGSYLLRRTFSRKSFYK